MKKKILVEHRPNGVMGYQLLDGTYKAILKAPIGEVQIARIIWDDPYNWKEVNGEHTWVRKFTSDPINKESDSNYDYFTFELKSREGRFKYFFELNDKYLFLESAFVEKEKLGSNQEHKLAFTWNHSSVGKFVGPKEWWNHTNWYQIFPDRFSSSKQDIKVDPSNYHSLAGGDLKGIIKKLDYIKELGFNGIYLNPIFKATSAHKYDTIDYFDIDPAFGTMKDFEELIKQIKIRDMKIMLDGVFNHCGYEFPYWQDVLKNKSNSKYKDWFTIWDMDKIGTPNEVDDDFRISGPGKSFSTFGNTPAMPRLNWANKDVSDYIIKITKFWAKKGIDAWRMDVADEVSFEMWRKVRIALHEVNADAQLLGEIWYDSQIFLNGDQFDSTMNYPFANTAIKFFVEQKIDSQELLEEYTENKYRYSSNINKGLFNLVGSHDTKRILDVAEGEKKKVLALFAWLFLNPGSPSFYYGDEIGNRGFHADKNREPFDWNAPEENEMYKVIQKLLVFRRENIDSITNGIQVSAKNNIIMIQLDNENKALIDTNNWYIELNGEQININIK